MTSANALDTATARAELLESIRRGLLFGAAVLALVIPPAGKVGTFNRSPANTDGVASASAATHLPRVADFGGADPSPDARHVADWVADSRNNGGADFVIVDKRYATVHVFDADARLRGSTPVLLGAAAGDDNVPGIGSRPISEVRPEERTTPAGRFIGQRGRNTLGEDVVWVDYAAAVSMHRVRATDPRERRLERLATPTHEDNRISYGCINVPVAFYDNLLLPTFQARNAVVYVLPETRPVREVFASYDVAVAKHD